MHIYVHAIGGKWNNKGIFSNIVIAILNEANKYSIIVSLNKYHISNFLT